MTLAPNHDRYVLAFHVNEIGLYGLDSVDLFSENELRTISDEVMPEWLPTLDTHRADGYTLITDDKGNKITLAIEVELSQKSSNRLAPTLKFYQLCTKVNHVLWLVGNEKIKTAILSARADVGEDSFRLHLFIGLDDFKKAGMDAVIYDERSGKVGSLREFYSLIGSLSLSKLLAYDPLSGGFPDHLKNFKSVHFSRA